MLIRRVLLHDDLKVLLLLGIRMQLPKPVLVFGILLDNHVIILIVLVWLLLHLLDDRVRMPNQCDSPGGLAALATRGSDAIDDTPDSSVFAVFPLLLFVHSVQTCRAAVAHWDIGERTA